MSGNRKIRLVHCNMWRDSAMRKNSSRETKSIKPSKEEYDQSPSDDVAAYLDRKSSMENASEEWDNGERKAFELQLDQLGTQLSETLIQKLALEAELDDLRKRNLAAELDAEKEKNRRLAEVVEKLQSVDRERRFVTKPVKGFEGWEEVEKTAVGGEEAAGDGLRRRRRDGSGGESVANLERGEEEEENEAGEAAGRPSWLIKLKMEIVDRLADFTDDDQPEKLAEDFIYDYPLTFKRLKSNLKRFTQNFKLAAGTVGKLRESVTWKSPLLTMLVFIMYMYSVWTGYLLHVILLLILGQLGINRLYADGIGKQLFGSEETGSDDDESSEKNKMQLVLDVARQTQNKLALAADTIEKIKNLLTWRHKEAGKKLLSTLLWTFLMVLILSPSTFFRIAGFGFGIKVFIVSAIYRAFPKVERRYGSTSRLFRALPTDAQLKAYNRLTEEEKSARKRVIQRRSASRVSVTTEDGGSSTATESQVDLCTADIEFCRRFVISPPEPRLPSFGQKGMGCSWLDKEKSLMHMVKPGKLHLTQSFLCFERMFAKNKAILEREDHVLIPLADITSLKKVKPISFMPGKGMALEVAVIDQPKPYIFGAILKRESAYEGIMNAGKTAGLDWAQ